MDVGGVTSYSMSRALELLHDELNDEVDRHANIQREGGWRNRLLLFHHSSVRTPYHWTSALLAAIVAILLLVAFGFTDSQYTSDSVWIVIEAFIIILAIICNICITIITVSQEKAEFLRLLKDVLKKLSSCMKYNTWNKSYFPRLEAPQSPCCTQQWTLRDGQVLNMHTALLVKGDIILMRPGHRAPARCKQIQNGDGSMTTFVLNEGEVYSPDQKSHPETFSTPQGRQPIQTQRFMLLETPFISCIRKITEESHRPASMIEHEKYTILTQWIERRITLAVLVFMFVVNIVRFLHMKGHVGQWTETLLILQMHAVIPLLPLILPGMWFLVNCYGQARVFAAFEAAKGSKSLCDDSFDTDSSISADEARVDLKWTHVLEWFKSIVLGQAPVVTRKINITYILGSITTLCCVDKKGILSYPNPTPEKIFFLEQGQKEVKTQVSVTTADTGSGLEDKVKAKQSDPVFCSSSHSHVDVSTQVLDVSSNPKSLLGLHFDDPSWKHHLNSLKPLGLTILANTCNLETAQWYTQFTDHVACAALENEETVAVVNRRCLCALAREIGFSERALEIFKLEKTIGIYRQVSAEMTTKERLQRAKSFIQNKIPMPNMVSVIVTEKMSGCCQLLSQGTADLVLNCCSDFWDGKDLAPLSESERKKILDFYQRTSIGSYCTAFSYRPVRQSMLNNITDMYIELPEDSNSGYGMENRMSCGSVDQDLELMSEGRAMWDVPRSFSADSLFDSSSIQSENNFNLSGSQCNQIFIGMVSMQYQARPDFIQLIDKLEGACIRFVHFSQENEVRSRVFAEKMGLEAGWNCHISLRSEKQYLSGMSANNTGTSQGDLRISRFSRRQSTESDTKGDNPILKKIRKSQEPLASRSYSAPSIVNLGSSQVKFETKVKTAIVSPRKVKKDQNVIENEELTPLHPETLNDMEDESYGKDGDYDVEIDGVDMNYDSDEPLSRQASSYITENTEDSLALDNRAKLPRGIENIRPHLRSIDNVPLLVNLFTDCNLETTKEMISIMQEHGEVVVCVGSAANMQNIPLFLQADCSLALEPLCPQVCLHQHLPSHTWDKNVPTPLQLASSLLSVTCPILIRKEDNISLIHLIAEARSHLMSMRNCFYFMMCCSLSVTFAQVVGSIVQLPPVLAAHHILWLVLFVVPLLGISMMGNPVDARVMSLATRKNTNHITWEMMLRFIVYFLIRFLPPVLVALLCYGLTIHSFCQTHVNNTNGTTCAIYDFMYTSPPLERTWYDKFSGGIIIAQNIFIFLLVLYFEIISLSFVHWTDHLWQQFPATNKLWLIITPVLLCCQMLFCVCDTFIRNTNAVHILNLADIHPAVWAIGLAFPVVMVVINELVKHREIKLAVRYQKRARLDFGTKLGMNSPF